MGNSEYRKTIDYILDLIRSGMLQVGDKLPTERSISEKLGISRNTVREALRGLEILGIVNGYQSDEIAVILHLNSNTVRSKRKRALEKIKKILEEGGYAYD